MEEPERGWLGVVEASAAEECPGFVHTTYHLYRGGDNEVSHSRRAR